MSRICAQCDFFETAVGNTCVICEAKNLRFTKIKMESRLQQVEKLIAEFLDKAEPTSDNGGQTIDYCIDPDIVGRLTKWLYEEE